MEPPPVTKKATISSISQTTTHAGHQQTRRKVLEEVEELDEYDAEGADEELEQSQKSADGSGIEQLMVRMVDDQRKRLAARTRGVKNDYDTSRETALNSINNLFDEHERNEFSTHDAKIKRLWELLARKEEIEAAMTQKLASLQSSHKAHSLDLEAVVQHKIKELK